MGINPSEPSKKPPAPNPWALAFGAGFELVVPVLLGVVAGRWADGKLGTQPWLLLLGTLAGFTLGLYQLIRKAGISKKDRS